MEDGDDFATYVESLPTMLTLLADGVADERNRSLLPIEVVERVRALGDEIVAGKIVVPDK